MAKHYWQDDSTAIVTSLASTADIIGQHKKVRVIALGLTLVFIGNHLTETRILERMLNFSRILHADFVHDFVVLE